MADHDREDKENIVPPPPPPPPFSGEPKRLSETPSCKEGRTPKDLKGRVEGERTRWEETLRKVEAENRAIKTGLAEREAKERAEQDKREREIREAGEGPELQLKKLERELQGARRTIWEQALKIKEEEKAVMKMEKELGEIVEKTEPKKEIGKLKEIKRELNEIHKSIEELLKKLNSLQRMKFLSSRGR